MQLTDKNERLYYQIRQHGRPDQQWSAWFASFELSYEDNITILTGTVTDQPELHALLARIRYLNLTLLSVALLERRE